MDKSSKPTASKGLIAGVVAVAILGFGFYSYSQHKKESETHSDAKQETKQEVKKEETAGHTQPSTASTTTSAPSDPKPAAKGRFNADDRQEIQDIFLAMIREKPDLFIGAVNDAMQAQQDKMRSDMEKAATDMKDKLLTQGITLGSAKAEAHLVAFFDPMCPHCHDFYRLAAALVEKRHDLAVHIVPVAILGPNSVAMAKILIATSQQGVDKMNTFFLKFVNKTAEIDRAKLLQMAKDSGIDVAKMEKDELAEATEKMLVSLTQLAEQMKIPGVPTIFGLQKDGKMVIVPPMDIDGFNKVIDSFKGTPATAPAAANSPVKTNKDER
ncbi:MAG: DsbA family protein [Alphaproteobacteria bacterium]|nr:DsbA family protein [Alphaproteobacteria bacterium]